MIDIHCHILHNIDDGPSSLENAEEMLRRASADGIKEIITTPHFSADTLNNIKSRIDELIPAARECGIKLHSGCEYTLSDLSENKTPLTLAESMFMLVDLNSSYIPQFMESFAFDLSLKGYRIILAHPEKLLSPRSMQQMIDLHRHGIFFQVNAASINGKSGKAAQKIIEKMIAAGICDYVASDAHSLQHRSFEMRQARSRITGLFGKTATELMFDVNPKLLLQNLEPETTSFKRKTILTSFKRCFISREATI